MSTNFNGIIFDDEQPSGGNYNGIIFDDDPVASRIPKESISVLKELGILDKDGEVSPLSDAAREKMNYNIYESEKRVATKWASDNNKDGVWGSMSPEERAVTPDLVSRGLESIEYRAKGDIDSARARALQSLHERLTNEEDFDPMSVDGVMYEMEKDYKDMSPAAREFLKNEAILSVVGGDQEKYEKEFLPSLTPEQRNEETIRVRNILNFGNQSQGEEQLNTEEMGPLEKVQNDFQAKYGGKVSKGYSAAVAATPFANTAISVADMFVTKDLEKLMKGDFNLDEILNSGKFDSFKEAYDSGEWSKTETKNLIKLAAYKMLRNKAQNQAEASAERERRGVSTWGTIGAGGMEVFALGGEFMTPIGAAGKGASLTTKAGVLAARNAVPFASSAARRYSDLRTNDYSFDEKGNLYVSDKADSVGTAIAKSAIGAAHEVTWERVGGEFLGKVVGATGGKLVGKLAGSKVGQAAAKNGIVRGVGKIVKFAKTPLETLGWHGVPGEMGEEFLSGATDAFLGLDTTESKKEGTTAAGRFKEFAGNFFKGENLVELAESMLLMQAVGGGSAYLQKRHTNKQLNKIITEKIGGVSENVLNRLSPEEKARIIEAHYQGLSAEEAADIINKGAGALDKFMIEKQTEATKSADGRAMLAEMNPEAADAIRAARREGKDISRKMIRDLGLSEKVLGDVESRNKFGDALLEDGRARAAKNKKKVGIGQDFMLREEIKGFTQNSSEAQRVYDRVLMKLEDASVLDDPYQREQLVMQAAEAVYAEDQARRVGGARQKARMAERADHEARLAEAEAQAREQAQRAENDAQERTNAEMLAREEGRYNDFMLAKEEARAKGGPNEARTNETQPQPEQTQPVTPPAGETARPVEAGKAPSEVGGEVEANTFRGHEVPNSATDAQKHTLEAVFSDGKIVNISVDDKGQMRVKTAQTVNGKEFYRDDILGKDGNIIDDTQSTDETASSEKAGGEVAEEAYVPSTERDSKIIQGTDRTVGEAKKLLREDVDAKIADAINELGVDIKVKGIELHGSRVRGDAKNDSDLDLVVEYSGDVKEDVLFEILNENPTDFNGIKVDINPINTEKTGSLKEYMARSEQYDAERSAKAPTSASTGAQANTPKPKTVKEGKAFVNSNIGKQYTDGKKTYEITGLTKDGEVSVKVTDKIGKSSEATLKLSGALTNIFGTKKTNAVWSEVKATDSEQKSPNRTKTTAKTPKTEQEVPKTEVADKKTARVAENAEAKRNESGSKAEVKKPTKPLKANPKKAAEVVKEFVAKDEVRSSIKRIHHDHDSGLAVATDGRILIATKHGYDPNYKDDNRNPYPNWRQVVPTFKKGEGQTITIDPNAVLEATKTVKKLASGIKSDNMIRIKLPNGEHTYMSVNTLSRVAKAMAANGITDITTEGPFKPLLAKNNDTTIVAMPLRNGDGDVKLGRNAETKIVTFDLESGKVISAPESKIDKMRRGFADKLRADIAEGRTKEIEWLRTTELYKGLIAAQKKGETDAKKVYEGIAREEGSWDELREANKKLFAELLATKDTAELENRFSEYSAKMKDSRKQSPRNDWVERTPKELAKLEKEIAAEDAIDAMMADAEPKPAPKSEPKAETKAEPKKETKVEPKGEPAPSITPAEAMKKLGTLGAADVDTLTKAMHREERLGHTERANMIRVLRDYKRGVGTNENPQSDETSGGKYRASVEAAKPLDDPAFVAWAKKRGVAPTTQKRNEYDKAMADMLTNRLSRWIKGVSVEWVNFIAPEEGGDVRHSIVSDKDTLSKLESGNTVKVYRAMQLIDGKLYPPMAAKVNGGLVDPTELGVWYKADEHPELAIPVIDKKTGKQKVDKKTGRPMFAFKLDKANGASIEAAYNPYWHTSRTPLNDQFSSASKRPNIVIVEVEVPASELTSDYRAEKAKDSVGEKDWHSGPVSSWLAEYGNRRKVILSRYNKVVRVVPDAEVAMEIKNMLSGTDISIPEGVITPSLREELKRLDVDISKEPRSAYSWKALTKNGRTILAPQITVAPFSPGTTTKTMIEAGRTSVRNAGGKDTEQGLVLNIPAFGDVVVIGKSGLKHGLRPYIGDTPYGKLDKPDNANILPVVGDILKHSVPINEFRPRKDSAAEGATVLIGAAFSEKGELIPVVSIVHHLRNTNFTPPVAIFPLHSINTKGRLSHAFDTQNTENALTKISLSDLISLVKDDIPLFSKDVYAHFKENRPADSNFNNLRYLHDGERIVGSYNRATGEVKLAKGASVETVLHELGWHAARHWAEVNADSDPKAKALLEQMKEYAESAPKEIKDAVRDTYGEMSADTLLDEIGAARFTKEQSGKIAKALATKEGAAWYKKIGDKVKEFFKNFLTKIGYNRVDLDGIEYMSTDVFGDFLADVMMSGKQLGERTAFSMEAPKGLAAKWTENLSDYKAPIAELEKRTTGSSNNIYYLARTLEGMAQRGKNRAERAIKRVEKVLGDDISPELLAQYMQLKAYEERNAKIERRNNKKDASGMTPEDAKAIEKTIDESGVDEAVFKEAAQILWDLQKEGLQARVDAGLLDQETANKWMTDEPHHIPWKDAVDPDSGEYVGRKVGAPEFDTAEGRKTAASGDPITWMLQEYQDAMTRAAQNRLRSSIANLTRLNGDVGTIYDGIQTDSKGKRSFIKYPKGGGKAKVLSIPEGVKLESTVKNDGGMKNVLTFKEGGETKYLVLNGTLGEAVAGAVTGRTLSRPIPYLGAWNRFSSATATTFSWAFAAKNYKRDTVDVRNNFIADFGWKKGNMLVASAEKFAWTHIKELSRYAATGELSLDEKGNPTTEFAKLVLEYEDAGGLMSGNAVQSYDHIEKQIKADFRFGKNRVRSLAKGAADLYMAVPKISELLTRIGAFAALRKDGMSAKDAAMWARESTFDFDKKGAFAPVLNSLWLFSNANIQAAHRQLRGLIKSKNGWKVAVDMAVVGFVMHIVNEMLNAGTDDDDEKEGLGVDKDISEYDRQHYIFLRFGQKMYRTPVNLGPYGFARYIGDVTARMMTGDISVGEAAKNLGVSAAEIGASSSGVPINMGAVVQTGFPSITQGVVQGLSGKNFAGFDLYKNKHPQNKTPDSHYGKRTTAPAYKWVAEKLNEITGGNEAKPGWIDIRPETVELVVENIGKSALRDITDLSRIPKAFLIDDKDIDGNESRYWDAKAVYDQDKHELDHRSDLKGDERRAYLKEHPWLYSAGKPGVTRIDNIVKRIEKLRDIEESDRATEERKAEAKAMRRKLQARVIEIMKGK